MICYGFTKGRDWVQEVYDGESGDARDRARALRKLSYRATVRDLGRQVTRAGTVRLKIVSVWLRYGEDYPPVPEQIERL